MKGQTTVSFSRTKILKNRTRISKNSPRISTQRSPNRIETEILLPNTIRPTVRILWSTPFAGPILFCWLNPWLILVFAGEIATLGLLNLRWSKEIQSALDSCFVASSYRKRRFVPSLYRLMWKVQVGARYFGYACLTASAAFFASVYSSKDQKASLWTSVILPNIASSFVFATLGLVFAGVFAFRRRFNEIKFGAGLTLQRIAAGFHVDSGEFSEAMLQLRIGFSNPDSKFEIGLITPATQLAAVEIVRRRNDHSLLIPLAEKILDLLDLSTRDSGSHWFNENLEKLTGLHGPAAEALVRQLAERWIVTNVGEPEERTRVAIAFVEDCREGNVNAQLTFRRAMERARKAAAEN
jgi:hypothetical protein